MSTENRTKFTGNASCCEVGPQMSAMESVVRSSAKRLAATLRTAKTPAAIILWVRRIEELRHQREIRGKMHVCRVSAR